MKTRFLGLMAMLFLSLAACKDSTPPANSPTTEVPPATPPPATTAVGADAVKAAVQQLLDLATAGDCAAMAPMIALSHTNTADDWKRGMNYATPAEKIAVDKQCAMLQVIVTDMKDYQFKEFSQEKESEGEWNIWVVEMKYADGSAEERAFAMLAQGNGYLLGDID